MSSLELETFAKVFDTKYGQVVMTKEVDEEEDSPCILFRFKPTTFGVCKLSIVFEDSDTGYDLRDKGFDTFDVEFVEEVVNTNIIKEFI